MTAPRSLQWRLSLWLGSGMALLWLATALVTMNNLRHELDAVFDSSLEETAQRILPLAVLEIIGREDDGIASQDMATLRTHDEYFTYVVRDDKGAVLLRSHGADDSVFPPFSQMGFASSPTHRLYFDAALQGTVTIAVAEPLAHRRAVGSKAFFGLMLAFGPLVLLSFLGVWVIVRLSMVPIRAFRSGIEQRGGGDLTPISAAALPSEIEPIAGALNSLLDRLRRTLEAERSFTASSAHELRTPVAAALAQTQRLISETTDASTLERATQIETALRRLARLSEKLMQLAKAEGGRLQAEQAVDVAPVLRMIVREMAKDGADRIELTLPPRPVMSRIDPDAFAILARNLIENALKHGAPDEAVRVILSEDGGLAVANAGEAVPPETLARLARPFERGDTHASGSGLGLAIANAIASGVGGSLTLVSPLPGQTSGFEAKFENSALKHPGKLEDAR
ncbi:sensor histidine kinase N-terminal domain-containing protein [Rhizobium sp. ARZ01]|uniref:sensor histidine kinase n=1 Tax=Rhizobium sp. ARZ01 TaxID=2769313 RepID=UPI00178435E3|nr:ATP-binding protein [Rhizobium sp. ARZ01]MBD9375030.1 sensor histidine kinase N-terminal domain-containing protein [Rhizobium sp. ARZ01]